MRCILETYTESNEDYTMNKRSSAKEAWAELRDIPVDSDDRIIKPYRMFGIGTSMSLIFEWFEREFYMSANEFVLDDYMNKMEAK